MMSGPCSRQGAGPRSCRHLAVAPWFADHAFQGRAVFPAVETMHLLASEVEKAFPDCCGGTITEAAFGKLLAIAPGSRELELEVELAEEGHGVRARLYSRKKLKNMSRLIEHGALFFPAAAPPLAATRPEWPKEGGRDIDAERIYQELVPFGPAYRTLQWLRLDGHMAWGHLQPADLAALDHHSPCLGSPFSLDGAFHAACVHGQQYVDFVPFPVGFACRVVHQPTLPAASYRVMAMNRGRLMDELLFDIFIEDQRGRLCETISGVRMRDVSGGAIRPPAWIREGQGHGR